MLEKPTKLNGDVSDGKLKIGKTSSALIIALLLAASSTATATVTYTLSKPATVTINLSAGNLQRPRVHTGNNIHRLRLCPPRRMD